MWSRNKIALFVILLSIVSGLIFAKALWVLHDADEKYQLVQKNQTKPHMEHLTFTGHLAFKGILHGEINSTTIIRNPNTNIELVNITIAKITIPNATSSHPFYARFTSPETFAVANNINYTIKLSTKPILGIKDVYFVLDSSLNNFYQNKTNIPYMIQRANESGELVKLKKENDTFFSKINGNWTVPIEDQISIFAILFDEQNNGTVSAKTPPLFTIAPHISKLQADTDLEIQRQNLENIKSNANVETLTWVIIGLIPIGFIIETVIHGYVVNDKNPTRGSLPRTPLQ